MSLDIRKLGQIGSGFDFCDPPKAAADDEGTLASSELLKPLLSGDGDTRGRSGLVVTRR